MAHLDNPKLPSVHSYVDVPVAVGVEPFSKVPTLLVAASDATAKVKQYADYVCTGSNDDVTIEEAINSLPASGGRVVLSEGNFVLSSSIDISKSSVSLEGSGAGTVIKGAIDTSYIKIGYGCGDIKISNLKLVGSDQTSGRGIEAIGRSDAKVKVTITNCWIYSTYSDAIYLEWADYSLVQGNFIATPRDACGIMTYSSASCVLSGNVIYSPQFYGIFNTYSPYVAIVGNAIYWPNSHGIYNRSANAVSIVGNTIYRPEGFGIYNHNSRCCTIVGNTAKAIAGTYGISNNYSENLIALNWVDAPIHNEAEDCVILGNRAPRIENTGYSTQIGNCLGPIPMI
ncbi:MAG: right-handed parallel beta-helix repeat-containing protein [Deltaproteobacteria bacterium]|nr:right-handed parallel beta-helix repeat-containing protein [Deltaproteobacteria bacterium]